MRLQDSDDRFTGITWSDNELQCDQHRFGRVTVTGYPIQLEQQPVTRIFGGAYGVGRQSGKEATLPPLPPLRTVRESFPSYGSSSLKPRAMRDRLP